MLFELRKMTSSLLVRMNNIQTINYSPNDQYKLVVQMINSSNGSSSNDQYKLVVQMINSSNGSSSND